MRICYIATGAFWFIDCYLEYFTAKGHEVFFIALSPSPERIAPVYDVSLPGDYSAWKGKWKYPVSMLKIKNILKEIKPDLVHTHYATSGGLAGLIANFHPSITTVHGSDLTVGMRSPVWRFLLKRIFNRTDCVNVVSEDLKSMAVSLGISTEKIEVFNIGIDTEKYLFAERPAVTSDRPIKMVCTRRLEQIYDHVTILKALAILHYKELDFRMTFVGGGSTMPQLKQMVDDAGMQEKVTFCGMIDNQLLPKILNENDVYLSASIRDGASLSLLEAMSTGIFPVVSDIKANSNWLTDGSNAFLHRVGDPEHLASCIRKVIENPGIVDAAANHNRNLVVENGDRIGNMSHLEAIYEKLISNHKQK